MKPKKITVIEWEDPSGDQDSWVSIKGAHDDSAIVLSVGWCYKEDEHYVYLAMDWSDDGHVHQRGKIPKVVIRRRREVRFPRRFYSEQEARDGK